MRLKKALVSIRRKLKKAVASAKGSEAEIIRQRLENNPTLIALENKLNEEKIKTEQSVQANQYASALIVVNFVVLMLLLLTLRKLVNKIRLSLCLIVIRQIIRFLMQIMKKALLRLSRLSSVSDRRDNSVLFREVDSLLEWIKG